MGTCRALCTAGIFLWTSLFPERTPGRAQEPAKQESSKQDPGPAAAVQKADTIKPLPGCAFYLEDGTRVNLTLGRELSSTKEITGNRIDFTIADEVRVKDVGVRNDCRGTRARPHGARRKTQRPH